MLSLYLFFYQNTYTNADKLLEAAEQLAQTGECDPEEIYKAARHLEVRIQDFVRRVEQRKLLLDMSVSFHTHTKEVRTRQPLSAAVPAPPLVFFSSVKCEVKRPWWQ